MTCERYIPAGYRILRESRHGIVYGNESGAIAYSGQRKARDWYYSFRTIEQRDKHVATWFERLAGAATLMAERKAKRDNYRHGLKVGDILYNSWGWEQTNIDWYEVVAVPSDKSVTLRAIGGEVKGNPGGSDMSGYTTPCPGHYSQESKPVTKRVREGDSVPVKHGWCGKWEGNPMYCSWYA